VLGNRETAKSARLSGTEQMTENDRRVRRTRRILSEALVSLVLDKGYDQITVQDILDRADVGRSTFYAHYRDKDALFLANFDDMRQRLLEAVDASVDPARIAAAVFEHAYNNRRVYQAMCGKRGGMTVHRHLHQLVTGLLGKDVAAEFYAGALLGVLVWWVDHGFRPGPEELAETYKQLSSPAAEPSKQLA
jgi:AcrR family transcriptional regulator